MSAQPVQPLAQVVALAPLAQQHDEGVAADARDQVAAARCGAQAPAQLHQHMVAAPVRQRAVDAVEIVDVDDGHGGQHVVAHPVGNRQADLLFDARAVGQAREGIARRRAGQRVARRRCRAGRRPRRIRAFAVRHVQHVHGRGARRPRVAGHAGRRHAGRRHAERRYAQLQPAHAQARMHPGAHAMAAVVAQQCAQRDAGLVGLVQSEDGGQRIVGEQVAVGRDQADAGGLAAGFHSGRRRDVKKEFRIHVNAAVRPVASGQAGRLKSGRRACRHIMNRPRVWAGRSTETG